MATRSVTISGSSVTLEALISSGDGDASAPVLLLCHPHPQHGGSMHDAVLQTAESAFAPGIRASLRFNFRGVGASEGKFDGGAGEVDDAVAAAQFLQGEFPSSDLWLAGYSFGSAMAWRARFRLDIERIILIAPPIGAMPFDDAPTAALRIDAIYGDSDEYVNGTAITAWADGQPGAALHVIPGCDHFFGGQHMVLERVLAALR